MKYQLFSDSCVDIPHSLAVELELEVLPLKVTVKGKEYANYLDFREIEPKVFYDLLREQNTASTAQLNPNDFVESFTPFLEKGYDILHLSFSSALSGSYNSSLIAKKELEEKYPERKIEIIDTLAASMGQGLLVTLAAREKQNGKSLEDLKNYVIDLRLRISHLFTVSDLGHLRRGGRLSASSMVLGNLLNIKPLLHVNDLGQLKVYEKSRGRFKSLNSLVHRMEETIDKENCKLIYISHGDCLEDAIYVRDLVKDKLGFKDDQFLINPIGPVIGAHSGVNTLAIFYIGNERETK
ncbi:MAG: fatty acid-binding protein DegV [Tenericutes bacterium HGW-Tenericutes-5]|nr:MAG: fatty acid-binding protein DegV [Tenericutes bacterium HGW-Tenericutes-5]